MNNLMTPNWSVLALARFILAFIVFSGHIVSSLTNASNFLTFIGGFGGKAAVIGFFIISGYSIAASFEKKPKGFFFRRMLRIYPTYFGAVLLTIFVQVSSNGPTVIGDSTIYPDGVGKIIGNFFLTQMFLVKQLSFNGPLWSLSLEVFYYVMAPFLYFVPQRILVLLLFVSLSIWFVPKVFTPEPIYLVLSKFNALKYLWCWLLGFWLFFGVSMLKRYVIIAVVIYIYTFIDQIYGSVLNAVVVAVTIALIFFSGKVQCSPKVEYIFNFLGDLSYPLYLVHMPLIILAVSGFGWISDLKIVLFCMAGTLIIMYSFDKYLKNVVFRPILLRIFSSSRVAKYINKAFSKKIADGFTL